MDNNLKRLINDAVDWYFSEEAEQNTAQEYGEDGSSEMLHSICKEMIEDPVGEDGWWNFWENPDLEDALDELGLTDGYDEEIDNYAHDRFKRKYIEKYGNDLNESLNESDEIEPLDSPDNQKLRSAAKKFAKNMSTPVRNGTGWSWPETKYSASERKAMDKHDVGFRNYRRGEMQVSAGEPDRYNDFVNNSRKMDDSRFKPVDMDKLDKINFVDMSNKRSERNKNNRWFSPKFSNRSNLEPIPGEYFSSGNNDFEYVEGPHIGWRQLDKTGREAELQYYKDRHSANVNLLKAKRKEAERHQKEADALNSIKQSRVTRESCQESLRQKRLESDDKPGKYLINLLKD